MCDDLEPGWENQHPTTVSSPSSGGTFAPMSNRSPAWPWRFIVLALLGLVDRNLIPPLFFILCNVFVHWLMVWRRWRVPVEDDEEDERPTHRIV